MNTHKRRHPHLNLRVSRGAGLVVLLGGLLAACQNGPVKQAASLTGFATTPTEPAQFVRDQRPQSTDYIPVGVVPPPRDKIKSQDELKRAEAELDALRNANEGKATSAKALGATAAPAVPKIPSGTN